MVVSLLSIAAVLAFLAVTHLVNRFREQEKALARHLYAQGQSDLDSGKPEAAIGYFRAALGYNRSDFEYQLSLARALRDTGRTRESKSYLMNLWERSPEDGPVNLALGRLAVRENSTGEAIHYYHNAEYGVWNADTQLHRRNAQFELVEFLLQQNAHPAADAELITLAASLPPDPELRSRAAQMFFRAGDYEHALSEYQSALQHDRLNAIAQAGAGEAAFQLRRYTTAEKYLDAALKTDPQNESAAKSLQTAKLVMQIDPFIRRISIAERNHRLQLAFDRAGERLAECTSSREPDQPVPANQSSSSDISELQQEWIAIKPKISRHHGIAESDSAEQVMDLVFQIEQKTEGICGEPSDLDHALLLLAQDRDGVDQ